MRVRKQPTRHCSSTGMTDADPIETSSHPQLRHERGILQPVDITAKYEEKCADQLDSDV